MEIRHGRGLLPQYNLGATWPLQVLPIAVYQWQPKLNQFVFASLFKVIHNYVRKLIVPLLNNSH